MPLLNHDILSLDAIVANGTWSLHQDLTDALDPNLTESIARIGLMRPPIVRKLQYGYELICGARRITILKKLNSSPTLACAVVEEGISSDDLLLLVAEDQLQSGPLSPLESARFAALHNEWNRKTDFQLLNRVTGTTSTTQHNRLRALLELEPPILADLHHGRITEKSGLSMLHMTSADRLFVAELFSRLSLNGNKQRRFLELVQIMTDATGDTIADFISEHFAELCTSTLDNVPQQSRRLMQQLHELSHPDSTLAARTFLHKTAEMNLPENCRISHSPAFETDKVTLEVEFTDFNQFSRTWENIKGFC